MRLEFFSIDSMHAGDLGCFQDAVGSLFWLEITNKQWYPNKAAGLTNLNEELTFYYQANADKKLTRLTPLVMSQVFSGKDPGYPYLKAKAAATRHVSDFCLLLAQRHLHGDPARGDKPARPAFEFKRRSRMAAHSVEHLQCLVAMFEGLVCYHQACAATPFVEDTCREAIYKFLTNLKSLNALWRRGVLPDEQKPLPFHVRQKAHMLQHMAEDKLKLWGSPSRFWCYRDEDYVGTIKNIASKTKHPNTLEERMCEKLRIWSALESLIAA
jgi:hypothetical protein